MSNITVKSDSGGRQTIPGGSSLTLADLAAMDAEAAGAGSTTSAYPESTSTIWVPILMNNAIASDVYDQTPGIGVPAVRLAAASVFKTNFLLPSDVDEVLEAWILIYPDATETVQFDLSLYTGMLSTLTENATITNSTKSVTINQVDYLDFTAQLNSITPGHFVCMIFTSDTTYHYVLGVHIRYRPTA